MDLFKKFNHMVNLLFNDTKVCVKINGLLLEPFKIKRIVKQGYLLDSYLFLIIGVVLNSMVMKEPSLELIK